MYIYIIYILLYIIYIIYYIIYIYIYLIPYSHISMYIYTVPYISSQHRPRSAEFGEFDHLSGAENTLETQGWQKSGENVGKMDGKMMSDVFFAPKYWGDDKISNRWKNGTLPNLRKVLGGRDYRPQMAVWTAVIFSLVNLSARIVGWCWSRTFTNPCIL